MPGVNDATGLSPEASPNRQIGARLFLSEKTIETHLTRVVQQLGLRSRAQVAAGHPPRLSHAREAGQPASLDS